ncbi:MAG: biopolymer transporter ExbD [Planctomycetota bacterium]|nr:biopolymer transporter ExbD [Planctomycetota bacterium]
MSRIHQRGTARIEANLTPMIDITFLLVVFFVLVSTISEVESVEMELPDPTPAASSPPSNEPRSVINVIPGPEGEATSYRFNGVDLPLGPAGISEMRRRITELYIANPDLQINLRADRRTEHRHIAPILRGITEAATLAGGRSKARVNLVVVTDRGSESD